VDTVLEQVYPRLAVGGAVIVDGYRDEARRAAVDDFRARHGITEPLDRIDWAGAVWRKQVERAATPEDEVEDAPGELGGAPLAGPPRIGRKDLTVVVVFYNMRREAERTLHSLSRAYQQGLDDVDYEVVVVENGSDRDQVLGREFVQSFGPEFRYLNIGRNAHPSPVRALNRGIAAGKGDHFALMIDGAHVLTPGVLRYGLLGLRSYEPAVVSTQQWYVGPGQQGESMVDGYDQSVEDRLFEKIEWPTDGYRLFDVSHFIGERDWLDGMWESNCLFVPRTLLQQVGGFDESFDLPGGEYANLDIYERMASTPGVNFTTILGEGSFHQVHGGTTTNQPELEKRRARIASYAQHYAELRGRGFKGHQKRIHYVGTMFHEANRTRARRRISAEAFKAGAHDPDGRATEPLPIPEEVQQEYTDAFWRSLRWEQTTWMGRRIPRTPTDLWVYQELLHQARPDWIIETSPGSGGRALYLASICEILGHGRVLSVGGKARDELPQHPRITYLPGETHGEDVAARVREITGAEPNALVILGSRGRRVRMVNEFDTFADLVPVGSYVIVEDTILNGHPVWASFGPGPAEAVKQLLGRRPDFVADLRAEKFGLTFNPGGFLKRVS
jgi:cephalosporin hydroxylase/glycosyltransferase involved in cell wall biosynthesis